jgi:molecular chaperone GrpE
MENKEEEILENEGEATEEKTEAAPGRDYEKELAALNDKYIRLVAEYDNYRKRTLKEKEGIYPEAKATVTALFLPVMDNLERALAASDSKDPLYEGLKMVMKQFEDALKSAGVEYIESVGQKFDPKFHNAVMHVDDENYGENEIVEEFQKGYKIGDRIVRHSMVKVAN